MRDKCPLNFEYRGSGCERAKLAEKDLRSEVASSHEWLKVAGGRNRSMSLLARGVAGGRRENRAEEVREPTVGGPAKERVLGQARHHGVRVYMSE